MMITVRPPRGMMITVRPPRGMMITVRPPRGMMITVCAAFLSMAWLFAAIIPSPAGAIGVDNAWVSLGSIQAGRSSSAQTTPFYSSSKNVFFASNSGGVFRSTDGGDSFVERNSGLGDLRVSSLGVSPRFEFDALVFALTPTGLYRSVDGALNWIKVSGGLPDAEVSGIVFAPDFASNQTLFAANTGFGLYRSDDAGVNWNNVTGSGLTRTDLRGVQVAPSSFGRLILIVWSESELFRSDDTGVTWERKISGLPGGLTIESLQLGPGFNTEGLALLGTRSNGIYRTTNRGSTWAQAGLTGDGIVAAISFSSDFGTDNQVFAGTTSGGFFRSTDGGASWSDKNTGLDRLSVTAISNSNDYRTDDTIFAGGGQGGIFRSTDGGDNWKEVASGLNTPGVRVIGFSNLYPSDGTLFVATQSGLFRSVDRGATWSDVSWDMPSRDVQALAVSPSYTDDLTILVGLKSDGIHRTFRENGDHWAQENSGLENSRLSTDPKSVATSPIFHNTRGDLTVFVGGGGGVARSLLAGSQWIPVGTNAILADVTSVALSSDFPSDGTLFAATRGAGVFKTTARGESWFGSSNGLGNFVVNEISVAPAFAANQTLLAATDGGVFISNNGGLNWTPTSLVQPASAVTFAPDFATSRVAYAASSGVNGAVHQSVDGGVNWQAIGNGLPSSEIVTLAASPDFNNDRNLFAGTGHRGLWVYKGIAAAPVPTAMPVAAVPTPTAAVAATVTVSSFGSATIVENLYVVDPSGANVDLKHNVPNLQVVVEGQLVSADFKTNFEKTGGVERWGLPISEVFEENGALTQYYQRGVVDFHRRGDLGGIWLLERRLTWDYMGGGAGGSVDMGVEPAVTNPSEGTLLGPWGHKISDFDITGEFVGFRQFFDRFEGTDSFGLPKTDARLDTGAPGTLLARGATPGRVRQYFQAGVIEFFPENAEGFRVQLTLLGDFLRDLTYPNESWRNLAPFQAAAELSDGGTVGLLTIN